MHGLIIFTTVNYCNNYTYQATSDEMQEIDMNVSIFIKQVIGAGGFGTVFKGTYKKKHCAVKVLNHLAACFQNDLPAGRGRDKAVRGFKQEIMVLESFRHPNVLLHFATTKHPKSGNSILVTELLDCNLSDYILKYDSFLTNECEIRISKDVACGLEYIHSKKVMHRDLCGANILMKIDNPFPTAKIGDFGMSKSFDPSKSNTTLIHRQGYIPREYLIEGLNNYDLSLDVFSCGVIMIQIVVRKENVESRTERDSLFAEIKAGTHPLKPFIVACLEKEKSKRPSAGNLCKLI